MTSALGLLERARELAAVDAMVAGAMRGEGSSLVVTGTAGIGKTALLGEAVRRGRAAGARVRSVRLDEHDSAVPFAVVRDLLAAEVVGREEPATGTLLSRAMEVVLGAGADRSRREGPEPDVLHALYWLVADVADRTPLVLVVDDAQWADSASLRFLDHLVRRVEGLAVAVLAAIRHPVRVPLSGAEAQVAAWAPDRVLRLDPLSPAAGARIARHALGADVPDDVTATLHAAAAGNPLLLHELAGALREAGVDPREASPELVRRLGAIAVAQRAEQRLARLGSDAAELARALAVVGDLGGADGDGERDGLAAVGGLVGLEAAAAQAAAAELAAADLVRAGPAPRFVHPLLREAVRETVPPEDRDRLARAAAVSLVERSERASAAAQLVRLTPSGDPWVVDVLLGAAADAVEGGAPDVAEPLLRRASAEPPDQARASVVLGLLGRAQLARGDRAAVATLEAAMAAAGDALSRAEVAGHLSQALVHGVRIGDAARVLQDAARELRASPSAAQQLALADELELRAVMFASWVPDLRELVVAHHAREHSRRERHGELARRLSLLLQALHAVSACRPAPEGAALAERSLVDDALFDGAPSVAMMAVPLLAACGRVDLARRHLDAMIVRSRAAGALPEVRAGIGLRGQLSMWEGDVLAAESDGWAMQELIGEGELGAPYLLGFLTDALLAQDRAPEARAELERAGLWSGPLPDLAPLNMILWARGRVRAAVGEQHAGLEDLLLCGRRQESLGQHNEALVPWRASAAAILCRLDRHAEAVALADEALTLARRFGAAHVLGEALRRRAVVAGPVPDVDLLREARDTLDGSFARLSVARVHRDLGIALLATGDPRRAREAFSDAAALARQLHATALAAEATRRLVAAGGRPRREPLHGAAALTPAERRVADLAATGTTNRDIARSLFVTEKTVESHLRRCYRKLGVGSRTQLADALTRGS